MRGKAIASQPLLLLPGITPAYAGKREMKVIEFTGGEDHPCICGEKEMIVQVMLIQLGSPLHMRGKVVTHIPYKLFNRITPAYAGKSLTLEYNPIEN